MNDAQRRKFDKRDREDVFMKENAADFPRNSPADKWTQLIDAEHQKIGKSPHTSTAPRNGRLPQTKQMIKTICPRRTISKKFLTAEARRRGEN